MEARERVRMGIRSRWRAGSPFVNTQELRFRARAYIATECPLNDEAPPQGRGGIGLGQGSPSALTLGQSRVSVKLDPQDPLAARELRRVDGVRATTREG